MANGKKLSKTQLATELAEATGTNKKTAVAFLESLSNIAYREAKRAGEQTQKIFSSDEIKYHLALIDQSLQKN